MEKLSARTIAGGYIHYRDVYDEKKSNGVDKKVKGQIGALNDAGLKCSLIHCPWPEATGSKIISCLPFFSDGIRWPDPSSMSDLSYLYIRRPRFVSKEFLRFLSDVKKTNPKIRIVYEIPTYPYDKEMENPLLYAALLKDRAHRQKLRDYVDKAAILSNEKNVFGMETIKIMNGIDLSSIQKKKAAPDLKIINIMMVAHFEKWHGLDRLIAGMEKYKNSKTERRIVLHIAGNGQVLHALSRKVKDQGLENEIIFHGLCNQDELNRLYDCCSLAVESLGFHRIGLSLSATLKSREYLAKGIPFISANDIDVFSGEEIDFYMQVPRNDNPIDINSLIEYHDKLYQAESQESLIGRIRKFADSHIGMNSAMSSIVNYLTA